MIREAEAKDRNEIQRLYQLLVPSNKNINVLSERIKQIKNDKNNYLFVYEEEEKILGTIFLTICLDAMFQMRPYGVVENMIVDTKVRHKGIGKKLLLHIDEICKEINCTKIMLLSNSKRIEAHRFFQDNGYNGSISKGFKKYLR